MADNAKKPVNFKEALQKAGIPTEHLPDEPVKQSVPQFKYKRPTLEQEAAMYRKALAELEAKIADAARTGQPAKPSPEKGKVEAGTQEGERTMSDSYSKEVIDLKLERIEEKLHSALTREVSAVKTEIATQVGALKVDLTREAGSIRTEVATQLGSAKTELAEKIGDVKGDVKALNRELRIYAAIIMAILLVIVTGVVKPYFSPPAQERPAAADGK